MIRASLRDLNGCAIITLHPGGGILTWQDWMCDAVSVLSIKQGDKLSHLGLFSFRTGGILDCFQLPTESLRILEESKRYVLVTDELESDWQTEGTILKSESCDQTGDFFQGIRMQMEGDLSGALEAYGRVLKAVPDLSGLPRLRSLIGICLRMSDRPDEAEQAYQKEIGYFPQLPDAYCNLGTLYAESGRQQLARTFFEQALEHDQFFLNALLQMSRVLAGSASPPRLEGAINYRLLVTFSDIPIVQEQLESLARNSGLTPQEFAVKLRGNAGMVTDPQLLRLMKRLESLRLNGSYLAAIRGFRHLLDKTRATHLAGFFQHWVGKRLSLFPSGFPGFLQPVIERARGDLLAAVPGLAQVDPLSEAPSNPATGVTHEEFYGLALEEILADGQITPAETAILCRLRHSLRIDETQHQRLFGRATSFSSLPLADSGRDFNPRRFLKKLVLAIFRDGKVDPQEQKFLEMARETLDISPEELTSIVAEVNP